MRILYGIQGTGNGHITRARAMAKSFASNNVEVDYFFSGRAKEKYFDMSAFNDYQTREGFTFAIEQGSVNKLKTIKNLKIKRFIKDVQALDLSDYSLVINDFEPVTAWASKLANIPCVGISHQASFLSHSVPSKNSNMFTRMGLKLFAPADYYLGVHWFPFHQNIIPPFIEPVKNWQHDHAVHNKVLVYLPFEAPDKIISLLKYFPGVEFYCYHPMVKNESINQHIHLRSPSRTGFLSDLTSAIGVIGNAGFELSSEALRYGKKLLVKPLAGQFEQASNAYTLSRLDLASTMACLNTDALDDWLQKSPGCLINYPSDPSLLTDWLVTQKKDVQSLSNSLWKGVNLPHYVS